VLSTKNRIELMIYDGIFFFLVTDPLHTKALIGARHDHAEGTSLPQHLAWQGVCEQLCR
jgi:hypothetical protein